DRCCSTPASRPSAPRPCGGPPGRETNATPTPEDRPMPQTRSPRRAAVAVEAAVVLLPFMIFVVGLLEYCHYQLTRHVVQSAAREGARRAVVSGQSATTADIEAAVRQL